MLGTDKIKGLTAALATASILVALLFTAALPGAAQAKSLHVGQSRHAAVKGHRISKRMRRHAIKRSHARVRVTVKRRPVRSSVSTVTNAAASHAAVVATSASAVSAPAVATATSAAPASSSAPVSSTTTSAPAASVASPAAVPAATSPTTSSALSNVAIFNRESFDYSTQLSTSAEANRYQIMVLDASDADEIPSLKAANPNLKILLYQDPLLARPSDPEGLGVCSTWPTLDSQDQSWILHDQNGDIVPDTDMADNYLMDVGNAAYQQSCVSHAISLAKQDGFDGIYFDDVNASVDWYVPSGDTVPEYPTDSSWQNAETSFLAYATPQLHAAGLMSVGNVGGAWMTPGLWAKWNSLLDGAMEQSWNEWEQGAGFVNATWSAMLQEAAWSEANHKYDILQSIDSGESENTFGLATMMLVAGGYTSYSTANDFASSQENWYSTYTAAQQLGAPEGGYSELSNGLYVRAFQHGEVVVNPTTSALSATLPTEMTDAASGQSETTVAAAADSGYILQAD